MSEPRYRFSIWHHPRVFRSSHPPGWAWECGCGSSSGPCPLTRHRSATGAAIAHVHAQSSVR